MTVRFRTAREDFPPSVEGLRCQRVLFYFAGTDGVFEDIPVTVTFTEQGTTTTSTAEAQTVDGALRVTSITGTPVGDWTVTLPDTQDLRSRFSARAIDDIVFVVTFTGRLPPYPA